MSTIEKLLSRLKERQPLFAIEALSTGSHRDAFEFGRVSGILQGLKMAEEILEEILGEDDNADKSKSTSRSR